MLKTRYLVLITLLSFIVSLAATVPVSLIWKYVEPYVAIPGVKIAEPQGTLWQGQTQVTWQRETAQASWSISPWSLFLARLSSDIQVSGSGFDVTANAQLGPGGYSLTHVNGYVDDTLINPRLRAFKATLSGRFWLDELAAQGEWEKILTSASGEVRWTGGNVSYPVGRETRNPKIVQLVARLSTVDNVVRLSVEDPDNVPVVSGQVAEDGWATLNVHQHLMKVANERWPDNDRDIVFDMKQKIF